MTDLNLVQSTAPMAASGSRLARVLLAACIAGASLNAFADTYPSRPITLVVPFAAGSGTDAIARVVAKGLSERLTQPVLVENRAGANAQIGVEYAARAKADGYTLLMATATSHSANPSLYKSLRYDPIRDFTPIGRTGVLPFVVAVKPSLGVTSVQQLIDYARAQPAKISFASPNSTSMLAGAALGKFAKVDLINVAYKAAPQALADILAGHIDMYVVDFGVGLPSIRSGRLVPLAMTHAKRSSLLPNVPPLAETLPGFDLTPWNGLFGPAGLSGDITDRLANELRAVLSMEETKSKLALLGLDVDPTTSPSEFRDYVASQLAHWKKMIEISGVQPE
jgi:tripartite-type tricarboxylate transporter receptor subunit TctC